MTPIPKRPEPNTVIEGVPAYDGWTLVELKYHEHAVAVRAVEALKRYAGVDAYGWWDGFGPNREYCADLQHPAKDVIAEIEASGWTP